MTTWLEEAIETLERNARRTSLNVPVMERSRSTKLWRAKAQ